MVHCRAWQPMQWWQGQNQGSARLAAAGKPNSAASPSVKLSTEPGHICITHTCICKKIYTQNINEMLCYKKLALYYIISNYYCYYYSTIRETTLINTIVLLETTLINTTTTTYYYYYYHYILTTTTTTIYSLLLLLPLLLVLLTWWYARTQLG